MTAEGTSDTGRSALLMREMIHSLVDVFHQVLETDNLAVNMERIFDLLLGFED